MGVRKTNYQGGSIISFIIVTVAISILLIGGVAWLRHRGESVRQAEIARQTGESDGAQVDPDQDSGESAKEGDSGEEVTDEQAGDESTDGAAGSSQDDSQSGTPGSAGQPESDFDSQSAPGYLPETGPTESIVTLLAISALTYAAARYTSSRRELARLTV